MNDRLKRIRQQRRPAAISLIVLVAGFAAAGCIEPDPAPPHPLLGTEAVNIPLKLLEGGQLDINAHRGKEIVILDFWATWCGPCRDYMPLIESIADDFKDEGVVLYSVNAAEPPATIRAYMKQANLHSAVALEILGDMSLAYDARRIPHTVIIGKQGRIQAMYTGGGRGVASDIRSDLKRLVNGDDLVSQASDDAP